MAITSVNRKMNRSTYSDDTDGKIEISDTWLVQVDSKYEDIYLVINDPRVPAIRSQYVGEGGNAIAAWCKSRSLRHVSDQTAGNAYLIDCKFDSEVSPIEDPLQRPAVFSFSFAKYSRVAEEDLDGKPVLNSAMQVFDPPPEMDDSRPTVVIERNEATFPFLLAVDYQDAVNSDTWHGIDPGKAKIMQISGTPKTENEVDFYAVRYEIELRREGWKKKILDRGYATREDNGKLRVIKDDDEASHQEPVLLDGNGKQLDRDGEATDAEPVFLEFDVYKLRPFNALNL